MLRFKSWDGSDLKGTWRLTIKIDGIRALRCDDGWISRAGKPLHNIPLVDGIKDCEVYLGSFKKTYSAIRTKHITVDTPIITPANLYSLSPLDTRLNMGVVVDPLASNIMVHMNIVNRWGYEGLVLRNVDTNQWLKVKPNETHDVLVTGYGEGEGKYKGMLGYLETEKGSVGTGFNDEERKLFWGLKDLLIGKMVEVSCMEITEDGKFRHASYVRLRPDKDK